MSVSQWLIRRAAAHAPEPLSQRLEEEWLADCTMQASAWSRLRFAVGCCWATRVIAYEHRLSRVAVAAPAAAATMWTASARHSWRGFSSRSSTVILVVLLHVAVFYALMTGLRYTHKETPPSPMVIAPPKEAMPQAKTPPVPPPTLARPRIEVPPPEFTDARDYDRSNEVTTGPVKEEPAVPTGPEVAPVPHEILRVQGGPGAGFPNLDDYYPDMARRLSEQGTATVRVCVDVHGRLTGEPTTLDGSGSSRLDEGALRLARAGSGHYRPSTEDGRPVSACYPVRIRFQLKN
jgi:periplasmic protein TonB